MSDLLTRVRQSPLQARVVPFVVFLVLTGLQGSFGPAGPYWVYFAKTLVGAWLLWQLRDVLPEMKWTVSAEAIAVGLGVFVVWVALDPFVWTQDELWYRIGFSKEPPATPAKEWNPFTQFGAGSALAWFFVLVRTLGSTLVVPPLEELFYRSFLYRFLISPEFERIPLNRLHRTSMGLSAVLFAFTHQQWLAAILCAVAFQWLVVRRDRLGDAMTAHALTNLLLSFWVVGRGAWNFW